jgi:hypothetical protein
MGFRPDTGNFNRLLTSLGIGLLLASLVVPYFFFHDTNVLLIPKTKLLGLTDTARQAIESRQAALSNLEVAVWIFAGLLFAGGVVLLLIGSLRLRVLQGKEDERLEIGTKREGAELEQLNPDELDRKRDKEAKEATEGEREADGADEKVENLPPSTSADQVQPSLQPRPSGGAPAQGEPAPRPRPDAPRQRQLDQRYLRTREAIVRIEKAVANAFQSHPVGPYKYFPEVKVRGDTKLRQITLDGLFRSGEESRPDIVLELRVAPSVPRTWNIRMREFIDRLLGKVARYEAITGRPASGWLLIVVPEDMTDVAEQPVLANEQLRMELSGIAKGALLHESEIPNLPEMLERAF